MSEIDARYGALSPQQQLDATYLTRQGIPLADAVRLAEMYGRDERPARTALCLSIAAIAVGFGMLLAMFWD